MWGGFVVGQRLGYARVSTLDQNDQRQLEGQTLDQVFTDQASVKNTQRPKLEALIRFARAGGYRRGAFHGQVGSQPG